MSSETRSLETWKSYIKYVLPVIACLLLPASGCTKIPYLVLFNNSGFRLTVDAEGTIYSLSPGAVAEIRYPGNTELLRIGSGSNIAWEYKTTYPDKSHMNGNKFYVQIESNGSIYVLSPSAQGPVKEPPLQPKGFPWIPR